MDLIMKRYGIALIFLCAIGGSTAYAGVSTGLGDTRTEACAQAKDRASDLSYDVASSCDCSTTSYGGYVCSVDWESGHRHSSDESSTPDRSSNSSYDDSPPSRFQQTTPPGQRFVPVQIPQRGAYNLGGMP